jgi:Peptidase family M28
MNAHLKTAVGLALGLWLIGSASPRAQQGGMERSGPAQPPLWLSDDAYLRWPLPPGAEAYASLSGRRIKGYINEIVAISRKSRDDGNQYWGRITGTLYDKLTTDWVAAEFRRIGLEQVRVQEFNLPPQWFPTSWDVIASGGGKTVPIKTAFPLYNSVGTSSTELEPVWLGLGLPADFIGRDVRGRAAVVYGIPTPGGRSDSALSNGSVKRAEDAGAAAVFIILGIPGNVTNEPAAGGTAAPARVPVFLIGSDDGAAIREMIEKGQAPRLRVRLAVETRTGLKTASVWGVLPGTTDENVAVMAHTEAFFDGAMDNASGVGTMIELAEHYARIPRSERRRTLTFFTTSAHHAPSGEDAGARWIHHNMQAMWAKTALLVNCEHTSQVQTYLIGNSLVASNAISARRWYVGGSDRLKSIVARTFQTFGIAIYSRPEVRPGGELGNFYQDAPSVHIIDHAIYHTDLDTPDLVPEPGLEAVVRAFAKIIDEANKLDLKELRAGLPTQ